LVTLVGALALLGVSAQPAPPLAAAPTVPGVAASSPDPASTSAQLTRVRFGSPQAISDAGVYIGQERGFFREQGLDGETMLFQSGPDTIPAVASGELEVAGGTISIALLNAVERGIPLRMVADKGSSRPGFEFSQVAVRRDLLDSGAVRDILDLRGRRIA